MLKKEQNHVIIPLPKKPSGPKPIVCHHCGAFSYFRPHYSKFQALKRIKRKEKFELFESCAIKAKPDLGENGKLLKKVFDVFISLFMCISVLILPTLISLLMRHSFQTIVPFG